MNFCKKYVLLLPFLLFVSASAFAADIWVAPNGNDNNRGTKESPLASIHLALRKARDLRRVNDPSIKGGIHIILKGGFYTLSEPLFIRPEDSGTFDSPTTIEAANKELPILSGGLMINNWQLVTSKVEDLPRQAQGHVWVASVPFNDIAVDDFRQLWINGAKAIRGRDNNFPSMQRILSWNKKTETCYIPAPLAKNLKGGAGLEMFIHQWWAIANLRVKDIKYQGDSAELSFFQPESHIQSEHPWPAPWVSKKTGNSAFYLSNAMELLDEPGEWFFDKQQRKVYYWPREGEDLTHATTVAAGLETIVRIQGTAEDAVKYVSFKGVSFQHAGWLRPSKQGHVPLQAGMYMLDAYKLKPEGTPHKEKLENQAWLGRPAAAVQVINSANTSFIDCSFEHLASTGLDYYRGNKNDLVQGNLFKDIGGTAINAGVFSDESFEAHLAFNPKSTSDITDGLCIANNLITDVTNEDWGCVGIGAGFVKNIKIEHNEINEVAYSGISLGWGWTADKNVMENNIIRANKIHHYGRNMYDVAGIYTLSAQPNSIIEENYIDSIYVAPYAHDHHHWFYLYCDEGSAYFTVKNNWTPVAKYLQNANGPGNVWMNNGPQVGLDIKRKAGLSSAYTHLLAYNAAPNGVINSVYRHPQADKPLVMQITVNQSDVKSMEVIKTAFRAYGIAESSFYYSKDKLFVFDDFLKDGPKIKTKIQEQLKNIEISVFSQADELFELYRDCPKAIEAPEWDSYILVNNKARNSFTVNKEILCKRGIQRVLNFDNRLILVNTPHIPAGSKGQFSSKQVMKAMGITDLANWEIYRPNK